MEKKIDILTLEVGSTITKANGFMFAFGNCLQHIAQGFAPTSVLEGDVYVGVKKALDNLAQTSGLSTEGAEIFVNSSAAGGLRMTVHGLTYSMTARAAKEASLGAGAIVKLVTAGALNSAQLAEIKDINPNLILLAGGVDYGEQDVVLENAKKIIGLNLKVPLLFAGNIALQRIIKDMALASGIELLLAENVFPDVDELNIEPLRLIIQEAFSRHIIHAPGMENLEYITKRGILPTPGAVLKGAEIFAGEMGDTLVFDVGGATTDVHSVTEGSKEFLLKLLEPEPYAKRTVEGDLGVYVNAKNIMELANDPKWAERFSQLRAMPNTEEEKELTRWLCSRAVEIGVKRHAGTLTDIFTPTGKKQIIKGKDLSAIKWVIGTGGALTRVEGGEMLLKSICVGVKRHLLPQPDTKILLDKNYLFSALGTIAQAYPDEVKNTFVKWVQDSPVS